MSGCHIPYTAARYAPPTELKAWGLHTTIDLYHCDPGHIRDAERIRMFAEELCKLIDMKRFGECQVVHFGDDERVAGYSMVQLIETSCITGHFSNQNNNAYIDIFSCKIYNPAQAIEFTKSFFLARDIKYTINERM